LPGVAERLAAVKHMTAPPDAAEPVGGAEYHDVHADAGWPPAAAAIEEVDANSAAPMNIAVRRAPTSCRPRGRRCVRAAPRPNGALEQSLPIQFVLMKWWPAGGPAGSTARSANTIVAVRAISNQCFG
jgi:hypothetical protein